MADNVTLNAGSGGDVIATEDITGVEYQKVKLVDGTAASTTAIPLSGDLTNGLDVDVTRVSGTVTVDLGANNDVTMATLPDTAGSDLATISGDTTSLDGKLPAAAAAADNFANPTTTNILSMAMLWDGATWDRAPGNATDGLKVNLGADNDVTVTGTVTVDLGANNDVTMATLPDTAGSDLATISGDTTSIDGKLPAAAAAADNFANPTTTNILSMSMVWDGATWDRAPGNATDGLKVNLGADNDVTVTSGSITETNSAAILADTANMDTNLGTVAGAVSAGQMQVDIVADGAGLLTTAAHDAAFGTAGTADAQVRSVQGIASMTPLLVDATGQGDVPITLSGETVQLAAGSASIGTLGANSGVDIGDVDVTSISAGSNLIGDVGLSGARTSGGTTLYKNIDVDESEDEVKGTAGQVYWIHAVNLTSAVLYLKLYNNTAATVVVGTTTPDLTFPVPTQGDTNGAGFTLSIPNGIAFSTAITIAATTGVADNDSGAPGANALVVNLGYA